MKAFKSIVYGVLAAGCLVAVSVRAGDEPKKPKEYTLKVCPVSDEKLGGDMGDPYVFVYGKTKDEPGRQIKLCCKSCLKDFEKEPKKFIKKIDKAEAAAAKAAKKAEKSE